MDSSVKALSAATLVNTVGDGLYIAGSALFFTRGLGLPVAEVGLGLTCAGLLGLGAGVIVGRLTDRHGAKRILIAIQLIEAVAVGSYVLVGRSLPLFILVATLVIACMQGADASQGALVGRLGGGDPVGLRAYLHSVTNVGISAGTVLAGVAIADGSRTAYKMVMVGDSLTFLGAAALLLMVRPADAAVEGRRVDEMKAARKWTALRDVRYLVLTGANAVMCLQYFVLAFAMPLWVIDHTRAPRWLVSPMLLTNTVLIATLQVRFSSGSRTPQGGARSVRRAGFVLAATMVLYAAASGRGEATAAVLLVAASVAHTVGELMQTAGAYGISYGMAAEGSLGEYLGVYGLGIGLCRAVAPGILTVTCLEHGVAGWLGLSVLMLGSGLVATAVMARAEPQISRSTLATVTEAPRNSTRSEPERATSRSPWREEI